MSGTALDLNSFGARPKPKALTSFLFFLLLPFTLLRTMLSLLAKRISSCFFPSSYHHHRLLLSPLLRLPLSTQPQYQEQDIPFMAQYLISSFGFNPDRALKLSASKTLIRIKTPDQPNSVVNFLKDVGLSDAQIKKTVLITPQLLRCSVERTLRPRYHELIAAGFTQEILSSVIQCNPIALFCKDILMRLQFWRGFVNNREDVLLKVIRRNMFLMECDIDKMVNLRINLLKEFGFSDSDIGKILLNAGGFMHRCIDSIRQILEQTEELGISRGTTMFIYGVMAIHHCSKETLERKIQFFKKTCDWSEEEISSVFKKFPYIFGYSEEKVKSTMEFLTRKAKLDRSSIFSNPSLLGLSLEKRLMPRHHVLSTLESKGLEYNCGYSTVIRITEEKFIEKFVLPYEKDVPGLREAYVAASGGKILG